MSRSPGGTGFLLVCAPLLAVACSTPDIPPIPPPDPPDTNEDAGPPAPTEPEWVRLELSPRAALVTPGSPSRSLELWAYDARGLRAQVEGQAVFESSAETVVTVSDDGMAVATGQSGTAEVRASWEGLTSSPSLIVSAIPVSGAIEVSDEQVVEPPSLSADDGTWDLGSRYSVTITGLTSAPEPDDVLIGLGEKSVGGRVVSVLPGDDGLQVELAVLSLDELFDELELDVSTPLALHDAVFDTGLVAERQVIRHADGALTFQESKDAWSGFAAPLVPLGTSVLNVDANVGPFKCVSTGSDVARLDVSLGTVTVASDVRFETEYSTWSGGLLRVAIVGTADISTKVRAAFAAGLFAGVDCRTRFLELRVPLPGAVGLVLGGFVPVGAGFSIEGQLLVAEAGFEIEKKSQVTLELGIYCPAGDNCAPYAEHEETVEMKPAFFAQLQDTSPAALARLRLKPAVSGYGWTSFELGPTFVPRPRFELLVAKIGLKQSADLALPIGQIADPDYASSYKLALDVSLGTGAQIQQSLQRLRITAEPMALTYTDTLALSPQATRIVADEPSYDPGDEANVVVELSQHSREYGFLGDNVAEVAIVHGGRGPDNQPFAYVLARKEVRPDDEQVELTFPVDTPLVSEDNLFAFVRTRVPLPEPFELLELGPAVWPHVTLLDTPIHLGDNVGSGSVGTEWSTTFEVPANAENSRLILELGNGIDTAPIANRPIVEVNGNRIGVDNEHLIAEGNEDCAYHHEWPDLGANCWVDTWECLVRIDRDITGLVTPGETNEVVVRSAIDLTGRCDVPPNWDDFDVFSAVVAFTD